MKKERKSKKPKTKFYAIMIACSLLIILFGTIFLISNREKIHNWNEDRKFYKKVDAADAYFPYSDLSYEKAKYLIAAYPEDFDKEFTMAIYGIYYIPYDYKTNQKEDVNVLLIPNMAGDSVPLVFETKEGIPDPKEGDVLMIVGRLAWTDDSSHEVYLDDCEYKVYFNEYED